MPSVLAAIRPVFTFAAHTTLRLNALSSGDDLLSHTSVRTIHAPSGEHDLLGYLGRLGAEGVREMRCLVIAPGDGQGLALDRLPQPLPAAVGLTSSGECLVLSGSAASVVPGMQMPSGESVRALSRLLVGAVAELSEWIEHHRPLIPLGMPEISPLDLPSEFSGDARRLCATASAVLETCGRIDEWTMERDRSAGGMRDPLREVAHLARRALSAAITTRTLTVSGRANR